MHVTRIMVIAVAGLVACLLPGPAMAKPSPAQKCAAAKQQAVGKASGCQLKCSAKAVLKGLPANDPVLGDCSSKCRAKLAGTFAKLEAKGGCDPAGDGGAVQAKATACASELADDLHPGGRSPSCTIPFRADARDVIDGLAVGLDGAGNLQLPASCGSTPVCCTGGTPVVPCGPLQFDFVPHAGEGGPTISVPAGVQDAVDVDIPVRLKTLVDLPTTVPIVGDCSIHVDTELGADPRVHLSFRVQFSSDRLRMGPIGNVALTGFTNDDIALTGGIGCQVASGSLGLVRDTFVTTLEDAVVARYDHLCRRCCTGEIADCAP
jgi:hypothetical protein